MPPTNNEYDRVAKQRRFWLIASVLAMFIVGIFYLATSNPHQTKFPQADQNHATTFDGMSAFVNHGFTIEQVNTLTSALSKFSPSAGKISVDEATIFRTLPGSGNHSSVVGFYLKIDSAQYRASVTSPDLNSVRLLLYNSSGKLVFDSH